MADDESLLPPTMPDSGGDEKQPLEEAKDSPPDNVEKKPEINNAKPEIENDLVLLFDEHNVPAQFRTFVSEQGVKSMAAFAATSAQMEKNDDNLIVPPVESGCCLTIGGKSSVR